MPKKLIVMLSLTCACSLALAVEPDIEQLRKKAEAGDAKAQYKIGFLYGRGDGVPKDYQEAAKWWGLAADQGHADAQFNLAIYYYKGWGVKEDHAESVRWYRMAADQGYAKAQF